MTVYADFGSDDQLLLRASLQAAALLISTASPGRKEETASEGFAAATFVLGSRPEYVDNTLVTSVIVELEERLHEEHPFPDYVDAALADGAGQQAVARLTAVAQLLDTQAPAEAEGYKRWLVEIANEVAGAGKEDQGFLGMGGVLVNDAEREALRQLSQLLGLDSAGG